MGTGYRTQSQGNSVTEVTNVKCGNVSDLTSSRSVSETDPARRGSSLLISVFGLDLA